MLSDRSIFKVYISRLSCEMFHSSFTHPGVRNACAGVLKGRQQAHSQVMSQVEQLIIIAFKAHLAKRMFRVCQQDVRRDKASQDPSERGGILQEGSKQNVLWKSGKISLKYALSLLLIIAKWYVCPCPNGKSHVKFSCHYELLLTAIQLETLIFGRCQK